MKEENKKLIEEYPFLLPYYYKDKIDEYDYEYTLLDDMPQGWKKAFGKLICEDIKAQLIKEDALDEYQILEIKEKYGELRWYDNGSEEIQDIIDNYSHISRHVCVVSGKINVPIYDDGWVSPYDPEYFQRHLDNYWGEEDKHYEKDYRVQEPMLTAEYEVKCWSKDGTDVKRHDCSDILTRMGVDLNILPKYDDIMKEKENNGNVR